MDFPKEFNKWKNNSKSKKKTFELIKIPNQTNFMCWSNQKQNLKSNFNFKMSN